MRGDVAKIKRYAHRADLRDVPEGALIQARNSAYTTSRWKQEISRFERVDGLGVCGWRVELGKANLGFPAATRIELPKLDYLDTVFR